ncbi:MAG: N-acetylglucosamine kinase [Bacillota bacterium]
MNGLYLGVDGGGTKTVALVGDAEGRVLGTGRAGGSNYQTVGLEGAGAAIGQAVRQALGQADAGLSDLRAAALALAGADFPSDLSLLEELAARRLPGVKATVVNDAWAAWRAGTQTGWGLVAIAGTGSNVAGRTPSGRSKTGYGLTYEFGSRGGAVHMLKDVLYHVFRAGLMAGPETALLPAALAAFSLSDVDALAQLLYTVRATPAPAPANDATNGRNGEGGGTPPEAAAANLLIPVLFELAEDGDAIAQQVIVDNAAALGDLAGGMARLLGLEKEEAEVVVSGSLFERPHYPLYRDAFTASLHRAVPRAWVHAAAAPPAVGAYLLALETGGVAVTERVRQAAQAAAGAPAQQDSRL